MLCFEVRMDIFGSAGSIAVAAVGVPVAALLGRAWFRLFRRTAHTSGSVVWVTAATVRLETAGANHMVRSSCSATVEFDTGGAMRRIEHSFRDEMERFHVGQTVRVLYDPANPRNAAVDQGQAKYTEIVFLTAIFVAVLLLHLFG